MFCFLELKENLALLLSGRTQLGFKVIKELTGARYAAHIYVRMTDDKRKLARSLYFHNVICPCVIAKHGRDAPP